MATKALTKWLWLDGDIGRRKVMELDGTDVVIELAPKYLGRGAYSYEWYLEIWPMEYLNPNSDMNFDLLIVDKLRIDPQYQINANGDETPIASHLDQTADALLSNIRKCTTCDLFFHVSDSTPEPWQVTETTAFCCRNHHDMWEAASESE
jgi:hypothetical protein